MKQLVLAIVLGLSISLMGCEGDPGPEGPQGEQGEQGEPGLDGKDGIDGEDGLDGANGTDGADGTDSPNKTFYFQHGFKGYTGARDTYINSDNQTTNYGSEKSMWIGYSSDPEIYLDPVIRFDNIDESMLPYLDNPDTEGSADDFYINEAVLYLYCDNPTSTLDGSLLLNLTFYDEADPSFSEGVAAWNFANEVEFWAGGAGGLSNGYWATVYTGGYHVSLPYVDNLSGSLGWIALPLPRRVVKSWISDPENWNKGLKIRLTENKGGESTSASYVLFYSSEHEVEDLRPLLFVNAEPAKANAGGRIAEKSWEEYLDEWESMSYDDKMAPLNRYLSAK